MSASDEDLLNRARNGDKEALTELLAKHGPAVRSILAPRIPRRWRSVFSIRDVMQETYTDAFLDIGRFTYNGEGSFQAWLTSLGQCNLTDMVRKLEADKRGGDRRRVEPRSRDESLLLLYEAVTGKQTSPSDRVAREENLQQVRRTLDQLPPHYRMVIELYDLEGRPAQEVARALDRSPGAVFRLRERALACLRELMGNTWRFFSKP